MHLARGTADKKSGLIAVASEQWAVDAAHTLSTTTMTSLTRHDITSTFRTKE